MRISSRFHALALGFIISGMAACGSPHNEKNTSSVASSNQQARRPSPPQRCGSQRSQPISPMMRALSESSTWLSYSEGPQRGHAIAKHVGRDEAALAERLVKEPQISASSSFTDLETAESVVDAILDANQRQLTDWMSGRGSRDHKIALAGRCEGGCGISITRGAEQAVQQDQVVVVVRRECLRDGAGLFVLTAYPGRP